MAGLSVTSGPPESVVAGSRTGSAPTGSAQVRVAPPESLAPVASFAPAAQDLVIRALPRAQPVSLTIPSIAVGPTALVDLGTQADGSLEVPQDFARAGWFEPGPAPGQLGPAVIAGHVDSKSGPAVFFRLGELRPGATVSVAREDGRTARFVVDKVERYPKDRFPTVAVYGDTTQRAELRLITCGGAFDSRTGHYQDNVVAYAHLV